MTRKLLICIIFLCFIYPETKAQVTEDFTDGNYTSNPLWISRAATDWIVNATGQLQSNNMVANSNFYLSTASTLTNATQWEFYTNLKFGTSGTNYTDIFLTASASDISALSTSGYFVRIGNTADEICLYRKEAGVAAGIKIIDGVDGAVSSASNNQIKIKVIRDVNNQWTLLRDLTGTGNNYFSEGNITDATFTTSSFFGILVKQSTVAGFAQKHFFDDIIVKSYQPDVTPPALVSITIVSAKTIDILFNEPLDFNSSQTVANYFVDNLVGIPATAILDVTNNSLVHVTFPGNFPSGNTCLLTVNNVKDISLNSISNGSLIFIYVAPYIPQQFDVVIDEIMADPLPQIGLPNNEWLELKNTGLHVINLQGWRINTSTTSSGPLPDFILKPDSFVIVCTGSAVASMAAFGKAISLPNFSTLSNDGDILSLISPKGKTIHAVAYSSAWYQNELKAQGGWSLEMTDTKNPCSGSSNWVASTNIKGGSPGIKNANDAINIDNTPPKLLQAYAIDDTNLKLHFDKPLDSLKAVTIANYTINNGIGIPQIAIALPPLFTEVQLKLATPLLTGKIYTITLVAVTDCAGNAIVNNNIARVALSSVADSLDIVVNEILFNPTPASSDYVEIYNRSNKVIDLKQLYIANRAANNSIDNITPISADNMLFFPQDFFVLTKDIAAVKRSYTVQNPDAFAVVNLPAYNNDKGNVILLNAQGKITDEVPYNDKWHFTLLANTAGVALERIAYNGHSEQADNWHSAATSTRYGTPTYKNSQFYITDDAQGNIKITPEIISPDNDGQDDFATIDYNFPSAGYVATITIFDALGRPVRYLQRNALCGTKGNFRWDGIGENNKSLPVGIYIIYTEVFNLKGSFLKFKQPIVLARRM